MESRTALRVRDCLRCAIFLAVCILVDNWLLVAKMCVIGPGASVFNHYNTRRWGTACIFSNCRSTDPGGVIPLGNPHLFPCGSFSEYRIMDKTRLYIGTHPAGKWLVNWLS